MKYLLLTLIGCCAVQNLRAQCTYYWETDHNADSSIDCKIQKTNTNDDMPGSCTHFFKKRILDSVILEIANHTPYHQKGIPDSSEFRMVKMNELELVHYSTEKFLVEKDSVTVHLFQFSIGFWSEDGGDDFWYEPELGVVGRSYYTMVDPTIGTIFLSENSCLTSAQAIKLKKLVAIMKNR